MERSVEQRPALRIALRPLALPAEHGGWGFVLEPIALALLVAPSWAGVLIGVGAMSAFLARQPLSLAAADWMRRRRFPRTPICERLLGLYGAVSILAVAAAIAMTGTRVLLPVVIAAPLSIVQFAFDLKKRGRTLIPEIVGGIAAGGTAAVIALAAGRTMTFAAVLWLLLLLRSIPAIVFVRAALGKGNRSVAIALHVAAVGIASLLWQRELAPAAVVVAMSLLLGRAVLAGRPGKAARVVGMRELASGVITVVLIGIGYRLG